MEMTNSQKEIHEKRMKEYGSDGTNNLRNVGLMWTGILQAEYGIEFDKPIPNHIVACMMSAMKISRVAQGEYKEDNYEDAIVYLHIAQKGQTNGTDEVKKTV